jgi:fucose permease
MTFASSERRSSHSSPSLPLIQFPRTTVSVYWATLTVGRIVSGGIAAGISPHTILTAANMGLIVTAALIWMAPENTVRCVGIALMGFACAPIFPTLIATTPARVGESHSANAISFQVAASILGQSLIPAVVGIAANQRGLQIVGPWLFVSAVLTAICFELMRIARRTSAHAARHDPGAAAAS